MPNPLDEFLGGQLPWVCWTADGEQLGPGDLPRVLLPGSFNPLHHGHTTLAVAAAERLGLPVAFELSVANVDKPDLPVDELLRRVTQFRGQASVIATRSATFRDKSALFPGAVFVVGADTAARIVHRRYYDDDPTRVHAALSEIRSRGCRFFVGGRLDAGDRFVGLGGLEIPEGYRDLFVGLEERQFRVDITSTALRQGR